MSKKTLLKNAVSNTFHNEVVKSLSVNYQSNKLISDIDENIPENNEILIDQIIQLKEQIENNFWLLGQRLNHVRENNLYKPNFDSFDIFVEKRVGIKKSAAYNAIFIFKNFQIFHARAHGSKLRLFSRIKDDDSRKKLLLELEEKDFSFRELEIKIKEITHSKKLSNHRWVSFKYEGMFFKAEISNFKGDQLQELKIKINNLYEEYYL